MELLVENVQSYPRPPVLEPVSQRARVMSGSQVFAATTAELRMFETHHVPSYSLPRADITGHFRLRWGRRLASGKSARPTGR